MDKITCSAVLDSKKMRMMDDDYEQPQYQAQYGDDSDQPQYQAPEDLLLGCPGIAAGSRGGSTEKIS